MMVGGQEELTLEPRTFSHSGSKSAVQYHKANTC